MNILMRFINLLKIVLQEVDKAKSIFSLLKKDIKMRIVLQKTLQIGEIRKECKRYNIKNIHQIALEYHKQKELQLKEKTLCYEMLTKSGSDACGVMQHHSTKEEQEMIIWSINHYLGLNRDSRVIESSKRAIEVYGTGCGTSAISGGHNSLHKELEERISKLFQKEDTVLFSTGYSANVGAISAIAKGKNNLVIVDRESHASILDGCKLAGCRCIPFKHNSIEDLEKKIKRYGSKYDNILVIVESVYSMSGEYAPLKEIVRLREQYQFLFYVDEAHAFGICGKDGGGRCQELGLSDSVDFIMTTLSKSTASLGGVISAKKEFITLVQSQANAYMFQASLSPSDTATALTALDIIRDDKSIVKRLWKNTNYFRLKLKELGFDIGEGKSPIIPIYVGDVEILLAMGRDMSAQGIFSTAITYPAVHHSEVRFRFIVNASHTIEHIDKTLSVLELLGKKYGLLEKERLLI